jgi:predicted MPP superfamily phosphohydrolase
MHVKLKIFALCAGAVALILSVWGFIIEPATVRNEEYAILIPRWPSSCDGIRVAVLVDLHVGSPFNGLDKLEKIVDLTRHAQPDLVLLAGDYVIHGVPGGRFVAPEPIAARLQRLSAPLGVWAVLGNHDWWFDAARITRTLKAAGIAVLDDAAVPLVSGACSFWLAGISDFWEGRHDVRAALAQVPAQAAVLAVTHNPDVFPDVPERVALTIAGHTHGGQVYIPGIGRPIVPSRYGQRFAIGHIVEDGRHLFVSPGLGTSVLPVRFLVPPEVSIVKIHSEARGPIEKR